ncbi:cytochrome c maturation protein CcmE [candidate division KSB1 bacterium]|nr:cytochrome c maturation protein CcmE [candidate division KSB1 bacterium]
MKPKIVIGVGLIVLLLGYFIFGSLNKGTTVYYLTVSELIAKQPKPVGENLRISGVAVPVSIYYDPDKIQLRFTLADSSDTLNVLYNGPAPDQLADAQQVVVEGVLDSLGVFQAGKVLLKCPSKYETSE